MIAISVITTTFLENLWKKTKGKKEVEKTGQHNLMTSVVG